jgi:hypothetical protein
MKIKVGRMVKKAIGLASILLGRSTFSMGHDGQEVLIELDTRREIKTLRQLLIMFELSGYRVYLRAHFHRWTLFVANVLPWHRNAFLIWGGAKSVRPAILCTDKLNIDPSRQKTVHFCYDYSPRLVLSSGHFAMPETMHPQIYVQYHDHERLEEYRRSRKKIRVLFSGNFTKTGYDNPAVKELLGKLSRYQILKHLQEKEFARSVSSQAELDSILAGDYYNGLVVIDSDRFRINQKDWLGIVSQADFFLCPPGLLLPFSHNAIEAMAVGTIPFINYPEWFFPHLTDKINCISFFSFEDLEQSLRRILQMEGEQIESIRRQVIDYYSCNLSLKEFLKRMLECPEKEVYLHLWEENEGALRRVLTGKK